MFVVEAGEVRRAGVKTGWLMGSCVPPPCVCQCQNDTVCAVLQEAWQWAGAGGVERGWRIFCCKLAPRPDCVSVGDNGSRGGMFVAAAPSFPVLLALSTILPIPSSPSPGGPAVRQCAQI